MAGEKHYFSALRVYFPEFARELQEANSFKELPDDVQATSVGHIELRGIEDAVELFALRSAG